MTVKDLEANWNMSVDAVSAWSIVVLQDGWLDGSGWGNNYASGSRAGWVGGKLIMKPARIADEIQSFPIGYPLPSGWVWMTVRDLELNWAASVAAVPTYSIVTLEDGWLDGSGWGSNYEYGPRAGWVGGKLIMKPK